MTMSAWLGASLTLILGVGALTACREPKPAAILYGEDVGAYCGMLITDQRYSAEVVTKTGKVYKFDSTECMVAFTMTTPTLEGQVHSLWVTDFAHPGTLIAAEKALYLESARLRSPMAVNLAAFAELGPLNAVLSELGGRQLSFEQLPQLVRDSGLIERVGGHGEAATPGHEATTLRQGNSQP